MDVCIWCIFLIFFKFQQIHFSRTSQFHFTKSSSNRHHKLLPTYSQYGKNRSHLIFFASSKVLGLRTQFKDPHPVIVGPVLINISYLKGLSTFIANLSPSFNFNDL